MSERFIIRLKTPNKPMREIAETQFGASLKRRNAMTSSARGLEDQRRISA